ncbi:Putative nuclease HARBI1 [Linum perenne]
MSVNPIVPMTYVDEDASSGSADGANMPDGHNNNKRQSGTPAASGRSKRGRKATGDAIVDAMLEIAAASKLRAAAIMKNTSANMDDIDLQLDEMELAAAAAGYYYFNSLSRMPPLASSQRRRHSERIRVVQERFQHSGETISRYFNNVLKSIRSLSREFLQPPPQTTPMEIHCSKRLYPYFKDCIGVIDGMHIPANVPAKDQSRFRNKKGFLSQNVLAACTFDLQFIFIYPGWEGSATDSRVLRAVLDDPTQNFPCIPEGKYYLVDNGYINMEGFIAPYPGVRSHLHQFRGANQLPRTAMELFNHRHSSLRNAIHKSFNVLKKRFPILKVATQYGIQIQRDIVIAACVLHNFVRHEERKDWLFASVEGVSVEDLSEFDDEADIPELGPSMQEEIAFSVRESMAGAMWNDFINTWDEW